MAEPEVNGQCRQLGGVNRWGTIIDMCYAFGTETGGEANIFTYITWGPTYTYDNATHPGSTKPSGVSTAFDLTTDNAGPKLEQCHRWHRRCLELRH